MMADTAELAAHLALTGIAAYKAEMSKVMAANAAADRSFGNLSKTAGAIGGHISKGVGTAVHNLERLAVVAGGAAFGAAGVAVKWAGDFEASLNTINTVARLTPDALGKIGDSIRKIAKDTGTPLEELTQGYYDLVSAGIKAADANGVLVASNRLAIGGLGSTAETVDLLTTAINAYGGNAKNAASYADIFAKSIERGKVTAAEIAASFAQVGPLAASYGIDIKEIAAAYAELSAKGFTAGDVATQFRSALLALAKTTPALDELQKKTGKSYLAIAGKQGLVVALQQLADDAKKRGIPITELVGRIEALNFITSTTGPNLKDYQDNLAAMGNAAGTAAAQMGERQKGLNNALAILKANVKDAGITIGSALIPELVNLSKEATTFLQGHQDDIKTFGKNLAGALKDAVSWAKSLDWKSIGDGLKTAAGAARSVMDAFMSAPDWLKTAVITGWGLNKLTGGALTGIGGEIAKGIGGQFLSRGASPANPLWVQSVTGGIPGGGGPGGLGPASLIGAAGLVVAAQGVANSTIPNGANPYNLPTTPSGFGPGLLDINQIAANKRKGGANAPDFAAMDQWAAQVAGDFGRIDQSAKAFNDGIRAMASASSKAGAAIEKDWLKTIDPDKIGARSKAVTGRDATSAQIAATRTRDELHQLKVITEKSRASNDSKLERLRVLAADAKAHGDTKTAAKIQTAITRMKADIKAQEAKTTTAVAAGAAGIIGAIATHQSDLNVYVTTNVTANSVTRATTSVARYGNTGGDRRYDP